MYENRFAMVRNNEGVFVPCVVFGDNGSDTPHRYDCAGLYPGTATAWHGRLSDDVRFCSREEARSWTPPEPKSKRETALEPLLKAAGIHISQSLALHMKGNKAQAAALEAMVYDLASEAWDNGRASRKNPHKVISDFLIDEGCCENCPTTRDDCDVGDYGTEIRRERECMRRLIQWADAQEEEEE